MSDLNRGRDDPDRDRPESIQALTPPRYSAAHGGAGGVVRGAVVAVEVKGAVHLRVRQTMLDGAAGASVMFADNGPGIPRETIDRIYDAFYSTKSGSGSGSGLWIVRSVVDRLAGTIQVRTRTGDRSYTIFKLFIPRAHSMASAAAASSATIQ